MSSVTRGRPEEGGNDTGAGPGREIDSVTMTSVSTSEGKTLKILDIFIAWHCGSVSAEFH